MGRKKSGAEPYSLEGWTLGRRGNDWVADGRKNGKGARATLGKFETEDAARAAFQRFIEARKMLVKHATEHTIGDLWELWLKDRAEDKLRNDIYEANWVSLKPFFAHRVPKLLTVQDCRDYAKMRFALGRSNSTVNTEIIRLRACLNWARDHKLITEAETPKIWVPQPSKARKIVLTPEQVKSLLLAAVSPHVELFIVLALTTGARHTAILDLTWDRIDWNAGTIDYEDDLVVDPMSKSWRKGRAKVPMNVMSRTQLEIAYKARQTKYVIEHGGQRLKRIAIGFRATVRRAGITDKVTPHTIRHSVATWLRERGVALHEVSQLLGHADMRTTDKHYTHTGTAYLNAAVHHLDQKLDGKR